MDVLELSGWVKLLLWLWVIIGGFTTLVLSALAAWKSGFHIRGQYNQQTGMREDSTLKWFLIIGGFFAGPPLVVLALEPAGYLLAHYWWVPIACTVVVTAGVVAWYVLVDRKGRASAAAAPARAQQTEPVPPAIAPAVQPAVQSAVQPRSQVVYGPYQSWARGDGLGGQR